MILIVLGTHELPFTRLLEAVDDLVENGELDEKIVVQCGHTKYQTDNMIMKKFVSYEEMGRLYDQARLILTHGGTGSIITGLKKGKKVIAAARLKRYGEHNDDHQIELVKEFVKTGYILEWEDGQPLKEVLQKVDTFNPKPFVSSKDKILKLISNFIDNNV